MERFLRVSDLDWTVMRPSGLFDAPTVSAYQLHEDRADGIFTSRADLAASMLAQLDDPAWKGKFVAVTTSEGAPTLLQMMRREAFGSHLHFLLAADQPAEVGEERGLDGPDGNPPAVANAVVPDTGTVHFDFSLVPR